jgi:hypothetical protein
MTTELEESWMLEAFNHFFSSIPTWLTILKYLGLGLAAGSSVWATVNVLTVDPGDGRKHLTNAGRSSIMFTMLGLIISIVSEDLARRSAESTQAAQVAAEAKRTNDIIIAGQPLTSLNLTWAFRGLDSGLVQLLKKGNDDANAFIVDQQGERDGQQNSAVFRERQLYPFLVALLRQFTKDNTKGGDSNVTVLFPLDDDQNAVVPFGFLDKEKAWLGPAASEAVKPANVPSLEIGSHEYIGNTGLLNWPDLQSDGTNATITWRLDPSTFAKSFSRQNQFILPTAKLPTILRVAVLFDIKVIPFATSNFALAFDQKFWNFPDYDDGQNRNFRGKVPLITNDFSSSVQLVPNNSSIVVYNYSLAQVYETLFRDSYGEANSDSRCLVFEYKLQN